MYFYEYLNILAYINTLFLTCFSLNVSNNVLFFKYPYTLFFLRHGYWFHNSDIINYQSISYFNWMSQFLMYDARFYLTIMDRAHKTFLIWPIWCLTASIQAINPSQERFPPINPNWYLRQSPWHLQDSWHHDIFPLQSWWITLMWISTGHIKIKYQIKIILRTQTVLKYQSNLSICIQICFSN